MLEIFHGFNTTFPKYNSKAPDVLVIDETNVGGVRILSTVCQDLFGIVMTICLNVPPPTPDDYASDFVKALQATAFDGIVSLDCAGDIHIRWGMHKVEENE